MSAFEKFKAFRDPIKFPSPTGHTYEPPPISYEMGIKLKLYQEQVDEVQATIAQNLQAAEAAIEKGEKPPKPKPLPQYEWSEDDGPTPENMLGEEVLNEMKKNNESFDLITAATHTVWVDFLYGRDAAEAYWNSGGDPKAIAETLYGTGKDHKIPLISTNTGGENSTKKQGSTNGTKSRQKPNKDSKSTTENTRKKPSQSRSSTQK